MKRAASEKIGISMQRGFWLRCFLGGTLPVLLVCSVMCRVLHAQIAVDGPIRLSRVEGLVINKLGKPVVGAKVSLVRDDAIVLSTQTNQSGEFRFDHASGRYLFRVERTEFSPAAHEIVATDEIVTDLERKRLYVVVGPGACTDECSSVSTSKREFDRVIRENSRH
jgi:hypothetical protein